MKKHEKYAINFLSGCYIDNSSIVKSDHNKVISWYKHNGFVELKGQFNINELRALLFLIGNRSTEI